MMNNKQLDDVSRTNKGDSMGHINDTKKIEDYTRRLIGKISPYLEERNEIDSQIYDFEFVADIVELAIAEEREACARKCKQLTYGEKNIPSEYEFLAKSHEFKDGFYVGADTCFRLLKGIIPPQKTR